jgi:hypothetical protein
MPRTHTETLALVGDVHCHFRWHRRRPGPDGGLICPDLWPFLERPQRE